MDDILGSIVILTDEGVDSFVSIEDIQLVDHSLDSKNPMTYVIYLEQNRQMLSEEQIKVITEIIAKLKHNKEIIARADLKRFVNEVKCQSGENLIEKVQY